jgi:hypothetical protein
MSCCTNPCDGSPCHWECVVSDSPDCDCHCHGEHHGWGAFNGDPANFEKLRKWEAGPAGKAARARVEDLRLKRYARNHPGERPPSRARAKLAEVREARQVKKAGRSLRGLSDEEMAHRFATLDWADERQVVAVSREMDRRDKATKAAAEREESKAATAARTASRRQAETLEHHTRLEAAYVQAENDTNGHMLSRAGQRAGIDPKSLWTGPEARARKYASEELNEHWDKHGRVTVGHVKAEARRSRQAEQEAHEAEFGPYSHLTYARMRPQDFDTSVPLSLVDESTVRAAQPLPKGRRDVAGTEDMFSAPSTPAPARLSREGREEVDRYAYALRGMTREKLRRAVDEHERLLKVTAPGGGSGVTWTPDRQAEERAKLAAAREELAEREKLG